MPFFIWKPLQSSLNLESREVWKIYPSRGGISLSHDCPMLHGMTA